MSKSIYEIHRQKLENDQFAKLERIDQEFEAQLHELRKKKFYTEEDLDKEREFHGARWNELLLAGFIGGLFVALSFFIAIFIHKS